MSGSEAKAIKIAPTNTCPVDFPELVRRSKAFGQFAPQIHLDVSDGKFTPVTSWPFGPDQWAELEKMADRREVLPLAKIVFYEAHLMVQEPLRLGTFLARVGVRRILAHQEVFRNAAQTKEAFSAWRAGGADEAGLAVLIETPISAIEPHMDGCDHVLLMSIATLGKQGAPFDERIFEKVAELHAKFPEITIGVDGGVAAENIARLVQVGATHFGVGSAITKTPSPSAAFIDILDIATKARA